MRDIGETTSVVWGQQTAIYAVQWRSCYRRWIWRWCDVTTTFTRWAADLIQIRWKIDIILHLLTQETLNDAHLHLAVRFGKLHSIFECIECMPGPFVWPQIRLKLLDILGC